MNGWILGRLPLAVAQPIYRTRAVPVSSRILITMLGVTPQARAVAPASTALSASEVARLHRGRQPARPEWHTGRQTRAIGTKAEAAGRDNSTNARPRTLGRSTTNLTLILILLRLVPGRHPLHRRPALPRLLTDLRLGDGDSAAFSITTAASIVQEETVNELEGQQFVELGRVVTVPLQMAPNDGFQSFSFEIRPG
jgi:hypothetical protein